MTKNKFLTELRSALSGLPQSETEERILFYSEMIDDRMEDGLSEEAAIAEIGSPDNVAKQIIADCSLLKLAKNKLKTNRRLSGAEIALICIGSPIWVPLLITAFSVFLAVFICFWSVIVSLWSVFASLIGSAIGGVFAAVIVIYNGFFPSAAALLGISLLSAGLSVILFYGCKSATKGAALLAKNSLIAVKKALVKKEAVK